jgi:hypothetical protein
MSKEFEILTFQQLMDLPPEKTLAVFKRGEYRLQTGSGWYAFDEDRCRTPAELLAWIHHLTDKTWFTSRHAHQLIELANSRGMQVDHGC